MIPNWLKSFKLNIMAKNSTKPTENTNEVVNNNESTENIESVEETNEETVSVLSKKEFTSRFSKAIEKFAKGPQEAVTEEEVKMAKIHLARNVGSKISHLCPENTLQVIDLVSLMIEGKYQNDKMLVLIEEMPEIGYGH